MEQTEGWAQRIAAHVGRRVAFFRDRSKDADGRKLTTQALAARTRELGHPLDRSVIAKLEGGHRQSITVPELVVLARALEVPPIQLLYPLGDDPTAEILPGRIVDAEAAMLWFTGWHDPFRDEATTRIGHGRQDPDGRHEWYETSYDDAGAPVHLYAEHRQLVKEYEDAVDTAHKRLPSADVDSEKFRDEVARIRTNAERAIRYQRSEMRRRGITVLPDLPPGLEHLR